MASAATVPALTESVATVTLAEPITAMAPTTYAAPMPMYSAPVTYDFTYAAPTASYIAPTASYVAPVDFGSQETSPGVHTSSSTGLTYDAPVISTVFASSLHQAVPPPTYMPAPAPTSTKAGPAKKEVPLATKAAPKKKFGCCH